MKILRNFTVLLAFACSGITSPSPAPFQETSVYENRVYWLTYFTYIPPCGSILLREEHPSHLSMDKRSFWTSIVSIGLSLLNGFEAAMAVGPLAHAGWARVVNCAGLGALGTANCLWTLGHGIFSVWADFFFPNSGIAKREITADGYEVLTFNITEPDGSSTPVIHTQIMPISNHSSIAAMLSARPNASSWAQVFNRQYGEHSMIHVFHRRINETEEGHDAGRLHQLRGHHFAINGLTKREEESQDGVIMDFLFDDGNQEIFSLFGSASPDTIASHAADTLVETFDDFGNDDVIATCATMLETDDTMEFAGDESHGVVAFGWNNQAFGFDGRAGMWVDGCAP